MNIKETKYLLVLAAALAMAYVAYFVRGYIADVSPLPIMGQRTTDDAGNRIYHTISPIAAVNQHGDTITGDDLKGRIHVANFFFTSCPLICPSMTLNMKTVQEGLDIPDLLFVSYSIDPKRDSSARMMQFAERFSVDDHNWHFLTADKEAVYMLARNSYFMLAVEGTPERNDFIHSEQLVLVDKELRIRGVYDGMEEREMRQLKRDILKLHRLYLDDTSVVSP